MIVESATVVAFDLQYVALALELMVLLASLPPAVFSQVWVQAH